MDFLNLHGMPKYYRTMLFLILGGIIAMVGEGVQGFLGILLCFMCAAVSHSDQE